MLRSWPGISEAAQIPSPRNGGLPQLQKNWQRIPEQGFGSKNSPVEISEVAAVPLTDFDSTVPIRKRFEGCVSWFDTTDGVVDVGAFHRDLEGDSNGNLLGCAVAGPGVRVTSQAIRGASWASVQVI